jgi:hypothetical protein
MLYFDEYIDLKKEVEKILLFLEKTSNSPKYRFFCRSMEVGILKVKISFDFKKNIADVTFNDIFTQGKDTTIPLEEVKRVFSFAFDAKLSEIKNGTIKNFYYQRMWVELKKMKVHIRVLDPVNADWEKILKFSALSTASIGDESFVRF